MQGEVAVAGLRSATELGILGIGVTSYPKCSDVKVISQRQDGFGFGVATINPHVVVLPRRCVTDA
jgi:hypothetical protein